MSHTPWSQVEATAIDRAREDDASDWLEDAIAILGRAQIARTMPEAA